MATLILALLACDSTDPKPVVGPDPGTCAALVVGTDYESGALYSVDLDSHEVTELVSTGGDTAVVALDPYVVLLERGGGASVTVFRDGDFGAPLQIPLEPGSNPHDAALIEGELWVSLYDAAVLEVFDPDNGLKLSQVDLAPLADSDGLPEADDLLVVDGQLWVGLQRFDRDDGWAARQGRIAIVDPASRAVVDEWEVGPSPTLYEPGVMLTGAYWTDDGGIHDLDGDVLVSESDKQLDFSDYAQAGGGEFVVGSALDGNSYGVYCVDPWTEVLSTTAFLADIAPVQDEVWVAARTSWVDGSDPGDLIVFDGASCTETARIDTPLEPYSIALSCF